MKLEKAMVDDAPVIASKTILLVDDQDESRITTKWFLGNFGYVVESARSAEEALARFDAKIHDLVITDNWMPGMTGGEMAHVLKMRSPSTPILMHSGQPPSARGAKPPPSQLPAVETVQRPFEQASSARHWESAVHPEDWHFELTQLWPAEQSLAVAHWVADPG